MATESGFRCVSYVYIYIYSFTVSAARAGECRCNDATFQQMCHQQMCQARNERSDSCEGFHGAQENGQRPECWTSEGAAISVTPLCWNTKSSL